MVAVCESSMASRDVRALMRKLRIAHVTKSRNVGTIEMLIDNLPYIVLVVMCILALLRIVQSLRARRARSQASDDAQLALAAGTLPRRDYSTATCPICGKYDSERPFISYAIDCHRDDCEDIEHADPLAHEH